MLAKGNASREASTTHDGFSTVSTDNVQVIDPQNDYETLAQYSVGNGTNPHDIAVLGTRAFITLYNPSADPNPADVIEMDLNTGDIVNRWSFTPYLNDDGDRNGNAEKLLLVDNTLYVALQDLSSNTFSTNANGLIGMIDVNDNTIQGVIELAGRNPISLSVSEDKTKLFVANMATYDFSLGDFDLSQPYGGIETVDLTQQQSQTLLADENLGGYVERIVTSSAGLLAVVSQFDAASFSYGSKIVSLPLDFTSADQALVMDDSDSDIREMFVDGNYLWISRRQINISTGLTEPAIEVVDVGTFESLGELLTPAAPVMGMTK